MSETRPKRQAGVFLPVWALPDRIDGIGTYGPAMCDFIEWAALVGFAVIQVPPQTPVNPAEYGSPYSGDSAFARNWLHIYLLRLLEYGDLTVVDIERYRPPADSDGRVDYEWLFAHKRPLLARAYANFLARGDRYRHQSFARFCATRQEADWLEPVAQYRSNKIAHDCKPWSEWSGVEYATRPASRNHGRTNPIPPPPTDDFEAGLERYMQWITIQHWDAGTAFASRHGVVFMDDMASFVGHDSADVWAHRRQFNLDERGLPRTVSGAPPDYYNERGQVWHHPHFDWAAAAKDGFAWHVARLKHAQRFAGLTRIDHFLSLADTGYWAIPGDQFGLPEATATDGRWAAGPGEALFEAYLAAGIDLSRLVVEDLGCVAQDVYDLRDKYGLPGMRVARFIDKELDTPGADTHYHNPGNYPENSVAYLTTHDTPLLRVWLDGLRGHENPRRFNHLKHIVLGDWTAADDRIHWDLHRWLAGSDARLVIFMLGDLLELGEEGNLNAPGTVGPHNWSWRLRDFDELFTRGADGEMILTERSMEIRDILVATDRA